MEGRFKWTFQSQAYNLHIGMVATCYPLMCNIYESDTYHEIYMVSSLAKISFSPLDSKNIPNDFCWRIPTVNHFYGRILTYGWRRIAPSPPNGLPLASQPMAVCFSHRPALWQCSRIRSTGSPIDYTVCNLLHANLIACINYLICKLCRKPEWRSRVPIHQ